MMKRVFLSPLYPPPYPFPSGESEIISRGINGNGPIRLRFLPNVQFATVEKLVIELPPRKQLGFYDGDYPSPSDPGAYFSVAHGKKGLIMFCGNHGWSSNWQDFEVATIVRYLWNCRVFNMKLEESGLSVSDDNYVNRPVSEDKHSYFANNVASRLQSMV